MRVMERELRPVVLSERKIRKAPKILQAIRRTDADFESVMANYPTRCYGLFAKPTSVRLDEEEKSVIGKLLGIELNGNGHSSPIEFKFRRSWYRAWITSEQCG